MKFCPECGSGLPVGTAKFCPNCGKSLWGLSDSAPQSISSSFQLNDDKDNTQNLFEGIGLDNENMKQQGNTTIHTLRAR